MSWTEKKPASPDHCVSVCCNRYGGSSDVRLILSFSGAVAGELALEPDDRIKFYLGHSNHAGMIRLEKDDTGPFHLHGAGPSNVLRAVIQCADVLPDGPREAQPMAFKKDEDGGVEIAMPAWFGKPNNA